MMSGFREFETDPSVSMEQALQLIRAALDDEGLALGPSATRQDNVSSVIFDGRKVFRVPLERVMTKEDDARMRAAWLAQRAQTEASSDPAGA